MSTIGTHGPDGNAESEAPSGSNLGIFYVCVFNENYTGDGAAAQTGAVWQAAHDANSGNGGAAAAATNGSLGGYASMNHFMSHYSGLDEDPMMAATIAWLTGIGRDFTTDPTTAQEQALLADSVASSSLRDLVISALQNPPS